MDAPGAAGGCDDIFPPRVPPPVFRSPNPVRRRHQLDAASEATSAAVAAAVAAAAASKRSVVADPLYFNPRPAAPGAAAAVAAAAAAGVNEVAVPLRRRPQRGKAARRARQERYKTQPVTFQEIQEVDEELSARCPGASFGQTQQPPEPPQLEAADEDSATFVAGGGQKFDFQNPPATAASTGGQSQSMKTLDSS